MKPDFLFLIDVVGSCNLKCPSCPVGNVQEFRNPTGFMEPELLDKIMLKATSECNITKVCLYNWTEALLHPELPKLIKIIQENYSIPVEISSNLNILKNPDELMLANPESFRVSTSGFTQDVYSRTHRGGNIERVKQNMKLLAESKAKVGAATQIHVYYHRYLNNMDDEERSMWQYAESLGFGFWPAWAFMMPLEKILTYLGKQGNVKLTEEDISLIESLALPLKEATTAAQKYKNQDCKLRSEQMTLDFQGNVQLCCAIYDASRHTLGSYLSTSLADLQSYKYSDSMCSKCMNQGVHVYFTYGAPEINDIATRNISMKREKVITF
jgi:MoaA/NifB/PqqE/SkfB family radical SAM enzyme